MATPTVQAPLKFTTHASLPNRLVLSILTGRPILVSNIRSHSTSPGLEPHEVSLLRLLSSITNGTEVEISYTGTTLLFRPGLLTPTTTSKEITHTIPQTSTRGLSYFILPLLPLLPFAQSAVTLVFTGPGCITSSTPQGDISVDTLRTALLPLLEPFGIPTVRIDLRVLQRSSPSPPHSKVPCGGQVRLEFSAQIRLPKTLHLLNPGRIVDIKGVASSVGVSADNNARMIHSARGILNPLSPKVYIFSDVSSAAYDKTLKKKLGLGFSLSLVAKSSTGCLYSADVSSPPEGGVTPEDVGKHAAYQLLETIAKGGCVQPAGLATVVTLMAMGSEDVSRLSVGMDVLSSENAITLARDMKSFGLRNWGIRDAEFEIDDSSQTSSEDEEEEDKVKLNSGVVVLSVVGRGIGNIGRKVA